MAAIAATYTKMGTEHGKTPYESTVAAIAATYMATGFSTHLRATKLYALCPMRYALT